MEILELAELGLHNCAFELWHCCVSFSHGAILLVNRVLAAESLFNIGIYNYQ